MTTPMPCPFCKNKEIDPDKYMAVEYRGKDGASIYCDKCGASGPESASIESATRKWNKRTP